MDGELLLHCLCVYDHFSTSTVCGTVQHAYVYTCVEASVTSGNSTFVGLSHEHGFPSCSNWLLFCPGSAWTLLPIQSTAVDSSRGSTWIMSMRCQSASLPGLIPGCSSHCACLAVLCHHGQILAQAKKCHLVPKEHGYEYKTDTQFTLIDNFLCRCHTATMTQDRTRCDCLWPSLVIVGK